MKPSSRNLNELPVGSSAIFCELEVLKPGEFTTQLHLFVDDQGAREVVFTVHGTVQAGR